jgi:hypothetical protein
MAATLRSPALTGPNGSPDSPPVPTRLKISAASLAGSSGESTVIHPSSTGIFRSKDRKPDGRKTFDFLKLSCPTFASDGLQRAPDFFA